MRPGSILGYTTRRRNRIRTRTRNRNRTRLLGVLDYDYDDRFAEHERENRSEGLLPYAHSCEPSPKKMDSGFLMN